MYSAIIPASSTISNCPPVPKRESSSSHCRKTRWLQEWNPSSTWTPRNKLFYQEVLFRESTDDALCRSEFLRLRKKYRGNLNFHILDKYQNKYTECGETNCQHICIVEGNYVAPLPAYLWKAKATIFRPFRRQKMYTVVLLMQWNRLRVTVWPRS